MWKALCETFFQKYISPENVVADVASGYCEFINNIQAKKKYAIDLNPDIRQFASGDVECLNADFGKIDEFIAPDTVDVFFVSNFLEHLDKKKDVLTLLYNLKQLLKDYGKILILQPNIRFVGGNIGTSSTTNCP